MSQWARTVDGDIALPRRGTDEVAIVRDPATCTAIKLKAELQFVQGEWGLDQRLGFPWVPVWRSKNPSIVSLRLALRKTILATPPVVAVDDLSVTYDRAARAVSYSFRARLSTGQIVSFP